MKTHHALLLLFSALILAACGDSPPASGAALDESQALGKRLFTTHCAACHATSGDTVIVGPSLGGIAITGATRVEGLDAAAYIEQSITAPDAYLVEGYQDLMVKNFAKQLTTQELDGLVDFLLTLDE
jgi:mono/diheme cytochrome c family protein